MPWQPKDATQFTKKASSPHLKRMFSKVANKALSSYGDEGTAIRVANKAVSKAQSKTRSKSCSKACSK